MRLPSGVLIAMQALVAAKLQQVTVDPGGGTYGLERDVGTASDADGNVHVAAARAEPSDEYDDTPRIEISFTSDAAGKVALPQLSAGDRFYLQLHVRTGGYGLTSFEVKLIEDASVCRFDPQGADAPGWPDAADYEGTVWAATTGEYMLELAKRWRNPEKTRTFFVKYSRLGRRTPLTSSKGRQPLGHLRMVAVTSGTCINTAVITTMFHSGGVLWIPPIENGTPIVQRDRVINVAGTKKKPDKKRKKKKKEKERGREDIATVERSKAGREEL